MSVRILLVGIVLASSPVYAQNIEPCWIYGEIPEGRNWCLEPDGTIKVRPGTRALYPGEALQPERAAKVEKEISEKPAPMYMSVSAGSMASMVAEEYVVSYAAQLHVDNPVAIGSFDKLRLRTDLTVGLLPDGSLGDVNTYNSIEFETGLSVRIGKTGNHWTSLRTKVGFATLRGRKESPNWLGGGIIVEDRRSHNFLALDILADQRPDGSYQPTVEVSGGVKIPLDKLIKTDRLRAHLVGNAVRTTINYGTGVQMQTRIGVMLSI